MELKFAHFFRYVKNILLEFLLFIVFWKYPKMSHLNIYDISNLGADFLKQSFFFVPKSWEVKYDKKEGQIIPKFQFLL